MASSTKLQLKFQTAYGEKTWNFNYADEDATNADIKNLVQVMIANGSIYATPPLSISTAKIIKTTETDITLD